MQQRAILNINGQQIQVHVLSKPETGKAFVLMHLWYGDDFIQASELERNWLRQQAATGYADKGLEIVAIMPHTKYEFRLKVKVDATSLYELDKA